MCRGTKADLYSQPEVEEIKMRRIDIILRGYVPRIASYLANFIEKLQEATAASCNLTETYSWTLIRVTNFRAILVLETVWNNPTFYNNFISYEAYSETTNN